jgi:diguanylate cyclase (GGDEF)-like protein
MTRPAAVHGTAAPPLAAAPLAILALDHRVRAREGDPWQLLQQAMGYAVEAYQKLAEQSAQIDYLQSLSVTDPLTGLANRRGFEQHLDRALALAGRHGETGVLALLDLDDLKGINDACGHAAGDALLRAAGHAMARHVRSTDTVARLGGDEFAVILLRTPPAEGYARARSLQAMLNRSTAEVGGRGIPVRVSMGVVPYGPGSEVEGLLLIADQQMYRDKDRRRSVPRVRRRAMTA